MFTLLGNHSSLRAQNGAAFVASYETPSNVARTIFTSPGNPAPSLKATRPKQSPIAAVHPQIRVKVECEREGRKGIALLLLFFFCTKARYSLLTQPISLWSRTFLKFDQPSIRFIIVIVIDTIIIIATLPSSGLIISLYDHHHAHAH